MGQVPSSALYGIVGDGRAACHFAYYLHLKGISYHQWSRRIEASEQLSARVLLEGCSTIFVLLSDRAIEPWILKYRESALADVRFVHFSGALVTELATGVHPLTTFGQDLYSLAQYERIPFIGDEGAPGLTELLPELRNPCFAIPAEQRPLYHALCVMAGNFSVLLWQKLLFDLEARFGIPSSAAIPYLEAITGNLRSNAHVALTGPLARGDRETLAANIRALEGDRFQRVYETFVETQLGDSYGEGTRLK